MGDTARRSDRDESSIRVTPVTARDARAMGRATGRPVAVPLAKGLGARVPYRDRNRVIWKTDSLIPPVWN